MASSLGGMLQQQLRNEVPAAVLKLVPEAEQVVVENVLRLAQAELAVLNLASTTVSVEGRKLVLKSALTGPQAGVSLSSMQSLQSYSPARVLDVRAVLDSGTLFLVIELSDSTCRMSTTEFEIVRITKKRRLLERLFP